jgi:hypothetical protein
MLDLGSEVKLVTQLFYQRIGYLLIDADKMTATPANEVKMSPMMWSNVDRLPAEQMSAANQALGNQCVQGTVDRSDIDRLRAIFNHVKNFLCGHVVAGLRKRCDHHLALWGDAVAAQP